MKDLAEKSKWTPAEDADFANFCQKMEGNSEATDITFPDEGSITDIDEWWDLELSSC